MLESKISLLYEVLKDAEAHPEVIDLESWARVKRGPDRQICGTTVCIAGSVVLKAGYQIDWDMATVDGYCPWTTDGRLIRHVAQDELGLSNIEVCELFCCESLNEAWVVAERITKGAINATRKIMT